MFVYRISKSEERARDISGTGAFLFGGRWNSPGTNMLYTSVNSSLAYLESLVHFNEFNTPSTLYITQLEIDGRLIEHVQDEDYPSFWHQPDNLETQLLGDSWILANKHLGFKVRSAINQSDFNILLNPSFPNFYNLAKIISVTLLEIDSRLVR